MALNYAKIASLVCAHQFPIVSSGAHSGVHRCRHVRLLPRDPGEPHHRGIRLPAVRAGRRHGLGVGRSVCRLRSRDVGVQFFLLPPLETFTIADLPNPSRAKSAVAAMRVNVLRLNLALDQSYPLTK
jgi:hypothetical protein